MRAIVWTVVGVALVAAVALLIYMKSQDAKVRQAGMPTAAELKRDGDRFVKKADEYLAEDQKLRQNLGARLTTDKQAQLTRMDSLARELKNQGAQLPGQPPSRQILAKNALQDLQQEYAVLHHDVEKGTK